jgi:hypothetical protein
MSALSVDNEPPATTQRRSWHRAAPVLIAATLALVYVLVSPPSLDLAAHTFRAWLFSKDPFGIWNNLWYDGHHTVGYSLLYPAAAAALTPQLAAGIAAVGTAALFEPFAHRHFGEDAWLGACLFAAATATDLFTGRLAFAFGALPALAAVVALDHRRPRLAAALGILTALCSPVDAVFSALGGGAYAVGLCARDRSVRPSLPGVGLVIASLLPVGVMAVAFPEGGTEPFAFSALWPVPVVAVGALFVLPNEAWVLRAGLIVYTLGTIVSYLIATPLGSNAARLGTFLAAPLAALLLWRRRPPWVLALVAAPLLYLGWQAPIRDLITASRDPSHSAGYYRPLLDFLDRQGGPPFRVEIPFTQFHWEAYAVASRFPIPRGWERQLDIKDNSIFYSGRLNAASYEAWLHRNAVRFVAVSDAPLDYAGKAESKLIAGGLPYLRLVLHSSHWRVYSVLNATPMAQGAAALTAIGPDWLKLYASRPGRTLLRVHFTPYWALTQGAGCVSPAGDFTELSLTRAGPATLAISFSLARIGARSPRCA